MSQKNHTFLRLCNLNQEDCILSFLWLIYGPSFVSSVEPFAYLNSQINSCL